MSARPTIYVLENDFDRLSAMLEKQSVANETVNALSLELDRATLVNTETLPAGTVTMNSLVHFKNEANDSNHILRLVYPNQHQTGEDCVSVLAPAGAALLGLRIGDRIDWPLASKSKLSLKIIHVTYAN